MAAQIPWPPISQAAFGVFVWNAACVMGIIYVGCRFVLMVRRQPSIDAEFATKTELNGHARRTSSEIKSVQKGSFMRDDKLTEDITETRKEIATAYERVQRADEERTKGLHLRLNAIADRLGELKGTVDVLSRGHGERAT